MIYWASAPFGICFFFISLTRSRDARAVRVGHPGRPLLNRALSSFYCCCFIFCAVSCPPPLNRLFTICLLESSGLSGFLLILRLHRCFPLSVPRVARHFHHEPSSSSLALASDSNLSDLRSFSDPANEVTPTLSVLQFFFFTIIVSFPKIETDRFDGKSNFVMWRRKMKAVLVQNKIAPAICSPEEYPESWKGEILKEKLEPSSHRFKSRSKSREKSKVKCFYCGKEGHMKNKCFKRIKDEKQCKHGKGGNKVDKTHGFESDGNSMFSEV
ncbi:hypothetical protein M9H77_27212 [Catharanthus roseus]|uniref:Uncharacterized protein n=1 Tax=Catharanthus roseus TaxID=4058 RepID=A0ACC0ACA1_CATRO|nr:hypothetical protein M9H77_27212 [Catharanthus roseus]